MPGVQSPPTPFPAHVERLVQVGLGEVERVERGHQRVDDFASCPRTFRSSAPGHCLPDDLLSKCPDRRDRGAKQPAQKSGRYWLPDAKRPTLSGWWGTKRRQRLATTRRLSRSLPSEPGAARRLNDYVQTPTSSYVSCSSATVGSALPSLHRHDGDPAERDRDRDSHHSRCPGDPKRPSRAGSDQVRDNEDGQYKPGLDHLRLEGKSHPHACHHQTHEPAGANGRDQRVGGQNQKKDEERCPP